MAADWIDTKREFFSGNGPGSIKVSKYGHL